jgi:hypothetical protein
MGVTVKSKSQHKMVQVATGGTVLDVVIGEGNPGSIEVHLDDVELAKGPEVRDLALGDGAGLKGKELQIHANVRDENPVSARSSVLATVRNLATGKERKLSVETESTAGDLTLLTLDIDFV